ncbi:HNH endonuclease [Thioclava sp. SK-1]|uniref:HNH endonuclease n=1 Tax=Thioclava sp. SK-1 TaxID=1889770 RepID=UPI0008257524|nr:HNH endonuclease [Thioclava sp. SK-1]OCX62290.1 HNH endonuclease [Thioclava sp. SK-1]
MNAPVHSLRTLILNADMQPLSYAPLSVCSWQQALVSVFQDRVIQVKAYDDVYIHSASRDYEVPAVIALKKYRQRKHVAFTRYNVFLRDKFQCQYCGKRLPAKDLTFDHVVPRCKGGRSEWTNIVSCCGPDNLRKGSKTPAQAGLKLLRKPYAPTGYQLDRAAQGLPGSENELHQTWMDFLYWDAELRE